MTAFRLVVVSGSDSGAVFDVPDDGATFGRSSGSTVMLTDPAVSRTHGALIRESDGLVWRDDNPRYPAQLGDRPAAGRAMRIGDTLVIGKTRLVAVAPEGGIALLDQEAGATAELSIAELGDRRGRADLASLIALGDAVLGARDRTAMAAAAAKLLGESLRAERVDVIAAGHIHDALASHARSAGAPPARVPREIVERALLHGSCIAFDEGGKPALVAAFAPRDTAGVIAGYVHVRRDAVFRDAEIELLVAAGRLLGGYLTARGEHDRAVRRIRALEERVGGAPAILGESPAAVALRAFVGKVAPSGSTVLLLGGSGTGKELVASSIHHASGRAAGPFVAINCAVLTDTLLESELFGHEKGAFTGATERKPGKLELADGGTLFLDEVGELPPKSQAKLLRVLEDRAVERVGGVRPIRIDVRIVAATNRDLEAMVSAGEFRDDLYFRLGVIALRLPALRERAADIPLLASHFLDRMRDKSARTIRGFSTDAIAAMTTYAWPGNVRELRNAIERAVVLGEGELISAVDLMPGSHAVTTPGPARSVRDAEREAIVAAMAAAGGNKVKAAAALGIDRTTLYKKLRAYGLGG